MSEFDFGEKAERERKKTVRRDHDAYMTPPALASAIVNRLRDSIIPTAPMKIIEPACGEGDFIAPCKAVWPEASIVAVDIRAEVAEKIQAFGAKFVHSDYLAIPTKALASADLIISNPPFNRFAEFVLHSLSGMRDGAYLVMLMRLGMLAWTEDKQDGFWKDVYPDLIGCAPICPRPSFTDDGKTDSQEYGIAVWQKGAGSNVDITHSVPIKWAWLWPTIRWDKGRRARRKNGG